MRSGTRPQAKNRGLWHLAQRPWGPEWPGCCGLWWNLLRGHLLLAGICKDWRRAIFEVSDTTFQYHWFKISEMLETEIIRKWRLYLAWCFDHWSPQISEESLFWEFELALNLVSCLGLGRTFHYDPQIADFKWTGWACQTRILDINLFCQYDQYSWQDKDHGCLDLTAQGSLEVVRGWGSLYLTSATRPEAPSGHLGPSGRKD